MSDIIRYPFFIKIINNLKNIIDPKENDLDLSMLFIYLYWYACKSLKHNNREVTSENIYNVMEALFQDHQTRNNLLSLFRTKILTLQNN